tara:strand:- start:14680 stop:14943 length:264 start_codon:yes stop_codon:yes gene_type:complete
MDILEYIAQNHLMIVVYLLLIDIMIIIPVSIISYKDSYNEDMFSTILLRTAIYTILITIAVIIAFVVIVLLLNEIVDIADGIKSLDR